MTGSPEDGSQSHTEGEFAELRARLAAAERELAERERRLADAEQLAGIGWWEWYPERDRLVWSDGLRAICGVGADFAPDGAAFVQLVHEEDRADVVVNQRAVGEDDYHQVLDYRVVRPDGGERYLRGRRRPGERTAAGDIVYRGVTQDLTELRTAELASRQARDALQTTFELAPIGMAVVALDGRFLRVNPAVCRLLEVSEPQLLSRSLRDVVHPDDRRADREQLLQLLAGEISVFQVSKRCLTDSGAVRWADASVSLVRSPDGRPANLIVQVQDVTARKVAEQRTLQAEAESRMQRDHAQAIIAAMHDGYALTIDGEIRAVNAAWCQMIGYAEQELIGMRPPYPFWVASEVDETMALRDRVVAAGGATFQIPFERRDGSHFEAEITATPAHGPDGEPIGFVNTLRDVSAVNRDRRELERMARTDSLTGLANRFVLEESLDHEAGRRTGDRQLALVLLDLDRFKQINDAHGHPVGDSVLVEVAERLGHTVRSGEVLARVGGEEFAWLLPAAGRDEAVAAADRARAAVACRPFRGAGELTMSAGVGVVDAPFDTDLLYELADRALYEAKQAGRNRTCCGLAGPAAGASQGDQPADCGPVATPPVATG